MTGRPHEPAELFRASLNGSGFPFQHAVIRHIEKLSGTDPSWVFQASEFPVEVAGSPTRIDFILGRWTQHLTAYRAYVVAECKRVNPGLSKWLFARAPYVRRDPEPRSVLFEKLHRVSHGYATDTKAVVAGCRRVPQGREIYHVALEARGDVSGEARGSGRGSIEDAATQVIRGAQGLVEQLARRPLILPANHDVPIVPAIVTTAELWTTEADLGDAELSSGRFTALPSGVQRASWVWYQYHMSPGLRHGVENYFDDPGVPEWTSGLAPVLDQEFARTIAVVSYDGIEDFLSACLRVT